MLTLRQLFSRTLFSLCLLCTSAAYAQQAQADLRRAFLREARPYYESVRALMTLHDPNLREDNNTYHPPADAAAWEKIRRDLEALDDLCKTKYAGLTNDPPPTGRNQLRWLPATWCEIAARRAEYEGRGRSAGVRDYAGKIFHSTLREIGEAMKDLRVRDEVQELLYERPKWRAEQTAKLQKNVGGGDPAALAGAFADVESKADELKAQIEREAPNKTWEQPRHSDPSVETFVRSKFASHPDFRGTKVLRIGLDYTTWKERESKSYVGSDSTFDYYKVEYNSYKRGWALVQVPNRPLCQAREWVVGKNNQGAMVLVSLGGSGAFMRCR